ncbi:MAG: hypothetical protein Kow0069_14360 [Promethearchaeota archaeon]
MAAKKPSRHWFAPATPNASLASAKKYSNEETVARSKFKDGLGGTSPRVASGHFTRALGRLKKGVNLLLQDAQKERKNHSFLSSTVAENEITRGRLIGFVTIFAAFQFFATCPSFSF